MDRDKKLDETKATIEKVSESISGAAQEVKKQAEVYSDEVVDYIQDYPIKAVLIAVGVGLLVGKLLL